MSLLESTLPGLAKEERLLLDLCATGLVDGGSKTVVAEVDWERFSVLARHHRVEPLIWRKLRLRPDLELPTEVTKRLELADQQNALRCLRLTACLAAIVDAFASERITAIPLKGSCLAARHYGDLSSRHAGDIDLLVAPADLTRANRVLRHLGCVQTSSKTHQAVPESFVENLHFVHHLSYVSLEGIPLELHLRLNQNPCLLPIRVPDIAARASIIRLGKTDLLIMPDDLQFLFLAVHGARHGWKRLQWIYDIALMVHNASPDEVRNWVGFAERHGLSNPAVQALVIAHQMLGIDVPEEVGRAYENSRRIRYMVRRAVQTFLGQIHKGPDGEDGIDLPLRLYRLSMSSRPDYLWHELERGARASWARVTHGKFG